MEAVSHKLLNSDGKEVGSVELNPEVFNTKVLHGIVHQAVRWQLARRRSGTHSALNRANKTGGGKKPFKQKGTGRARAGSSNSPVWVGGAVAHGPQPRSYDFRFPKRARRQALTSVLTSKRNSDRLVIVDELVVQDGKTKNLLSCLNKIGVQNVSAAIIVHGKDQNIERSSGNLKKVKTLPVEGANVYDLLKHQYVVLTKASLEALQDRLLGASEKEGATAE
jgi:large subunit ribosomal protein L4